MHPGGCGWPKGRRWKRIGHQTVLVPPKERSLDSVPVQAKMARDHIFLRNKMGPQRIGFKKFTITD